MTVASGREFLMIPGPTTVPDEVLAAMHRPAIDIYSGALVEVTTSCLADLRAIFRTDGRVYVYAANGHGAWEAALTNVLSRGDLVLALDSGRFARGWGEMAAMMGVEVEVLPGSLRRAVDPAALEARLHDDAAGVIKAILAVQVDTASGVVNDIEALRRAIDAAGHGALLMVDTIASLATMPFEMDGWGVDVAVAGAQKGLMTPPGLGFVAAGERALAAHRVAGLRTLYWDWTAREGPEHYQRYCGTPPEHLMFGLRRALDLLRAEGLEAVFRRHRLLAEAVRRAVWSGPRAARSSSTSSGRRSAPIRSRRSSCTGSSPRSCASTAGGIAASCSASASASSAAARSGSATWATSTRRRSSARSARSRWRSQPSACPTAGAACRRRSTGSGSR